MEVIIEKIVNGGVNLILAILILIVGQWVAKKAKAFFISVLENKAVDPTLIGFFASMLYGSIVVFVVIAAVGRLGVETTSFAAVVAAAGLAIGLALQGSLSNFAAGGFLILF